MPIIEMHLLEGRSDEEKERACIALTDALVASLDVRREQVIVLIHDTLRANYSNGGVMRFKSSS